MVAGLDWNGLLIEMVYSIIMRRDLLNEKG